MCTHPLFRTKYGAGRLVDENQRQVSWFTKLLLLMSHDDGQRIDHHLRVHSLQLGLLLSQYWEGTWYNKKVKETCIFCIYALVNNYGNLKGGDGDAESMR